MFQPHGTAVQPQAFLHDHALLETRSTRSTDMRSFPIAVAIVALVAGGALAQGTSSPGTSSSPGTPSPGTRPPPTTEGTVGRQAPIGHRQPTLRDLPADVQQREAAPGAQSGGSSSRDPAATVGQPPSIC